jgi:hypothetical protein
MSENLKYPLVAILLAPEEPMWIAALREEKQITIRQGHRDYREGTPAVLCCHIKNAAVMVDITEVRHCSLRELTDAELKADGFLDHQDCITQMRRFYSDIDLDSAVTVVRWKNIHGSLVDRFREEEE